MMLKRFRSHPTMYMHMAFAWSVHGQMQHWLVLLLPVGLSLPRQEVQDQVPGDADHPIAPYHVVSGHNQVIAMGQVSEEAKEGSSRRTFVQRT